ncbi:MAG: hypothetical protein ACOC6U_01450 [Thermoplasmatota archaeon]
MRRTVKIKLSLEDRKYLEKTIQQFKQACQVTVNAGWNKHELKITKRSTLHDMMYKKLRDMTDLQANLVVRAISRAKEAIKGCVERLKHGLKASKLKFTSNSIAYDKRTLSVYLDEKRCTISTVNGRINADFVLPKKKNGYYKKYLNRNWNITQSTIEKHEYEDGEPFYLHLGLKKEENEKIEHENPTVMGVDLGINNLAVTSTGRFFEGDKLFDERKRFENVQDYVLSSSIASRNKIFLYHWNYNIIPIRYGDTW